MFRFADKVFFNPVREVGTSLLVGFILLGAGASLSPAAGPVERKERENPLADQAPVPAVQPLASSVTLPEPASPWFYSLAGGLCLLILARRKAQL